MKALRFLHAADLHLDSPFQGLTGLPDDIRACIRESTLDAYDALIRTAIGEQADFVLFAGDIYDAAERPLRAQFRFRQGLERLDEQGIGAFVTHGNHDPMEEGSQARLAYPPQVHLFSSREPERVPVERPGRGLVAMVQGMSFAKAAVTDNLAVRFRGTDDPVYQIGLLHANVGGDASHDNYAPCTTADLHGRGIHYWALGHIHARRVLQEDPFIVYPGNLQGRSVKESGPKGCYLVEVSEGGETRLSFRETDAVRWVQTEIAIDGLTSEQELHERMTLRMEELRQEAAGRPVMARFILNGRGSLHRTLRSEALLEEWLAVWREEEAAAWREERKSWAGTSGGYAGGRDRPFVWMESCRVRTGLPIDASALAQEEGFLGDLLRLAEELSGDKPALEGFAREALEALLAHPKAGREAEALSREEAADWLRAAVETAIDRIAEEEGWL